MTMMPQLLRFVRDELAPADDAEVNENTPLIDAGILDSMALMRLMMFVEERAGVRIPDDEVTPDNFQSAATIDSLIARLKAQR